MPTFNDRIRQVILLGIILLIGLLLFNELKIFLPGLMGALTIYILTREIYFNLTIKRQWKKGLTALLMILGFLILIGLPIYMGIRMISPKVNHILQNPQPVLDVIQKVSAHIQASTGMEIATPENMKSLAQRISTVIPQMLNSTAVLLANVLLMFFALYYLLVQGRSLEKYFSRIIPLKPNNIDRLAAETKNMIRANALGIPLISIVQGVFAALGYWIFGVTDWPMWGFLTGLFAFFPMVGTMIIWVPVCLSVYASGAIWPSIGLALYSLLVTGNVDYVARLMLMKRIGDVHPMVTILGVIVGLNLFGFMGLIFGPLLISYFIVMLKIYNNEFLGEPEDSTDG